MANTHQNEQKQPLLELVDPDPYDTTSSEDKALKIDSRDYWKEQIISDLDNKQYHSITERDGIKVWSSTSVRQLIKSISHLKHHWSQKIKPSGAMDIGSLIHALILEPDDLPEVVSIKASTRHTKIFKEALRESDPSALVMLEHEIETAHQCAERALQNRYLKNVLVDGQAELSIFFELDISWKENNFKIPCKIRPDFLLAPHLEKQDWIDIKTTSKGIDSKSFGSIAGQYGNVIQCAWYRRGLRAAGIETGHSLQVAVSTVPPVGLCEIYRVKEEDMNRADFIIDDALETWARYMADDSIWTGPSGCDDGGWPVIKDLNIPRWSWPDGY